MLRVLRWTRGGAALGQAVAACAEGAGAAAPAGGPGEGQYAFRVDRLGVPIGVRGALVGRNGESLLLELETPIAKLPIVDELYAGWVRAVATGR